MVTATYVKRLDGWQGDARLYKLSRPVEYTQLGSNKKASTRHVIVSAVVAMFSGPETYIFPSDAEGNPKNMLEMPGSFKGSLDHAEAILAAGWTLQ